MKKFLKAFAIMSLITSSALATPLVPSDSKLWMGRVATKCEANFKASHSDKKSVCECVARNFLSLAEQENSKKNTIGLLEYVEKYYAKELSSRAMEKDPYYLDDAFQDVGEGCLADSTYSL